MRVRPTMLLRLIVAFAPEDGSGGGAGAGAGGGAAASAGGAAAGDGAAAGAAAAGGAGAAAQPAFAESLPEAIRGEAAFRDIKSLDALANSYLHAQKLIGADPNQVLRLPAAGDDAAMEGVWTKLGRPEKADGYKFTDTRLPEGMTVDETLKTGFQAAAHKAGLSDKQADGLYQWWNSQVGERFTAGAAETARAHQAAEQGLRQEWGAAFDQNLNNARQAVEHYGGAKLKAELEASGMGNHPELAKVFAKMGANLQEDGLIGRGGGGGGINSPGEARQQIAGLQQDPVFVKAWTDKKNSGHADAVARMAGLYAQAYPEQA